MAHKNSVFSRDPETFEVLNQIHSQFTKDWSSDVILHYKNGVEVEVQLIHDVAYHFHKHGTPEASCVVTFLEYNISSEEENEGRAQLIHIEHQKRGNTHFDHIENVKIRTERTWSVKDIEELLTGDWQ